jgi:hypothetical protein
MAIALAISGKPLLEVDSESITIGSDPTGIIAIAGDDRIKPRHAVIRRVAGRWLVEVREAESIQVGDSEPGRVHWLNPGDVIRLVENGPEITFQPANTKPAPPPAAPSIPLAPVSAPAKSRPVQTDAPALKPDSLFEPLTSSVPSPAAVKQTPAVRRNPAAMTPLKPESRQQIGESPSTRVRSQKDDNVADYIPAAEGSHAKPLPKLRSHDAGPRESVATSQTTIGWIMIWVAVGLGLLAVIACIWFGSTPAAV